MDVWLKVCRFDGNNYRIGDVVDVYLLRAGETVPSLENLTVTDGRVPFCSLGVRNLPAKVEFVQQVRDRLLARPFEDEILNDNPDLPPNIVLRAKREVMLDPARLPAPTKAALFDVPPYTATVTWGQLLSRLFSRRHQRTLRDDDVPDKRPDDQVEDRDKTREERQAAREARRAARRG